MEERHFKIENLSDSAAVQGSHHLNLMTDLTNPKKLILL